MLTYSFPGTPTDRRQVPLSPMCTCTRYTSGNYFNIIILRLGLDVEPRYPGLLEALQMGLTIQTMV